MRCVFLLFLWLGLFAALSGQIEAATHVVKKNETLGKIAAKYGVKQKTIIWANKLENPNYLLKGQKLIIPEANGVFPYKVRKGDTLGKIAVGFGISAGELARFNGLARPDLIKEGQVLKIPAGGEGRVDPYSLDLSLRRKLEAIRVKKRKWRGIVIHHSATEVGSARGIDRYHREQRRMVNGLAYHFVIGNGRGMRDGVIAIGDRWRRQIKGGHLKKDYLNRVNIGICLIGNFEKTHPTKRQIESLEKLIRYLRSSLNISLSKVTTHRLIHKKHTKCPGKNFPFKAFKRKLR